MKESLFEELSRILKFEKGTMVMMGKTFTRDVLKRIYGENYTYRDILEFYRKHWKGPFIFEF